MWVGTENHIFDQLVAVVAAKEEVCSTGLPGHMRKAATATRTSSSGEQCV